MKLKKSTFQIVGMHCPSCAILIEKKLLEKKGIESVKVSLGKNEVAIEYRDNPPDVKKLSRLFQKDGYAFSDQKASRPMKTAGQKVADLLTVFGFSLLVVLGFFLLKQSGFSALLSVNSQSALPAFMVFGLLAGFSTCSALVGGIILSVSRQWSGLYSAHDLNWKKFQPHLMFNTGRLIGYVVFGALLGVVGSALRISLTFTSLLTMAISVLMIFLAL
ncbi:cation transporter, partial [Patescibacteria group bacterium]|nr:cation transporter [Patescibacteria group bacterium]